MDVSLEVEVNHLSSSSALRGSVDQTVAQAPTIVIEEDIINYLVDAMAAGDQTPGKRVQRRALIVAPQYEAHFRKYRPLPATIYDVYRVHQMLSTSMFSFVI
ncbi:hypothetical protein FRC12_008376 [Ceratobasidium sp. 428]|nr:hypothetical protein FRC12_008376 [Ceratobasidium sp. 428]